MSLSAHAPELGQEQDRINRLGFNFFIASEAVLFLNLIAAFLYLRFRAPVWPPEGVPEPDLVLPLVNTVILLGSSIPIHLAHSGIKRGDTRRLIGGLIITIILGTIFMAGQAWEYTHVGFAPQDHIFGSAFFTLTGFHGAHVIVGLIFLLVILALALRGRYDARRHFGVEAATLYWHFVDAVWIAVLLVVYIL
jgi:cytochrome c oxidase subunit III